MKKSSVLNNQLLKELGVLEWGYTEESKAITFSSFEDWTSKGLNSPLIYLEDERKNQRKDVKNVFPEFNSSLVFLFSYQKIKKWMLENNRHEIAAYALGFEGEDYHRALKKRLDIIKESLNLKETNYFYSIDTQPILERDLAYRAGLGWFGKNSMLINRQEGSYFIIASILLSEKLNIETKAIDTDHCGTCSLCAEACPTNAIDPESRTLIADRCISTYTIEIFKDAPAPLGMDNARGEIFGCDICQDVCPWNKKVLGKISADINLKESFNFIKDWFYHWPKDKLYKFICNETNRSFKKKLFGTAFSRTGRVGWLKNLKATSSQNVLLKKQKDEE